MTTIKVKGMSCEHCRRAVTEALSAVPGINEVQVSLEKGEASFAMTDEALLAQAKQAVRDAGYETD